MPYASRFFDTTARLFPLFTTFLLGPIRPSPDDRMGKHGARFCVGSHCTQFDGLDIAILLFGERSVR